MSEEEKRKRSEYKRKRAAWKRFGLTLIILVSVFAIAMSLVYYKLNETYYISYEENGSVDYKVYLGENEFYDEEYLGSGQAYVSTLIENVVADFKYELAMESGNVSYDYSYKVDAQLIIKDKTSGNALFDPTYVLVPEVKAEKNSSDNLKIAETVDINYKEYNELAERFTKTYGISDAQSSLLVKMHVSVISQCESFEENTVNEYVTTLNIPLTAKTLNIQMTSTVPTAESKILACDRAENKDVFKVMAIAGAGADLLLIVAFLLFIYLTRNTDINYAIKVKKLVNAYKSFIQKIINPFDTTGYQILVVDTFLEMLEIRDTIQSPILMNENEDQTKTSFLIPTNTKILYTYEIKIDGYDEIYGIGKDTETAPVVSYVEEPDEFDEPEVAETPAEVIEEPTVEEPAPEVVEEPAPEAVEESTPEAVEESAPVEEESAPEVAEPTLDELDIPDDMDEDEESGGFKNGIRYDYSFRAKLILSSEETRDYYRQITGFARSFGVKVKGSWKKERIYLSKNRFALLFFKGMKLCVALALDPKKYEDSKYTSFDLTGMKKYDGTPLMLKMTSPRQMRHAIELLEILFTEAGLKHKNKPVDFEEIPYKSKRELVLEGLIRTEQHIEKIDNFKREAPPVVEEPAPEVVEEPAPEVVEESVPEATLEPAPEVAEPTLDELDIPDDMDEDEESGGFKNGIRYDYSFRAKLILSSEETRDYYRQITGFARSFGVKVKGSWKKERIYLSKNRFALLFFKGMKLCVALALDPKKYEDSKYTSFDLTGMKKYDGTPLMLKMTSPRQMRHAIELLEILFVEAGLKHKNKPVDFEEIPYKSKRELVLEGLIRTEQHIEKIDDTKREVPPVVEEPAPEVIEEPAPEHVPTTEEIVEMLLDAEERGEDMHSFKNGIRYDYSFESKLMMASEETKEFYRTIAAYVRSHGVKISRSWKRERIYFGKKHYATLVFKGTRLAVAFALDPKEYEETKYKAQDVSGIKKFAATPMLMKLTSQRRLKYAKELLAKMFAESGIEDKKLEVRINKIPTKSKRALIRANLIKVHITDL